jgi:hypothetical protein
MKSRDMALGAGEGNSWTGQLFLGPLADSFPGVIRTVPNSSVFFSGGICTIIGTCSYFVTLE